MSTVTPTTPRTLGQKLRWARKASGLSHDKLGAAAGCSRQHLIALEKDRHRPGDELLARIAEATDQPLEFFVGTKGERLRRDQKARFAAALQPLFNTLVDELLAAVHEAKDSGS